MKFKFRTLEMVVGTFEAETIEKAIEWIKNYEKENNTLIRVYEVRTGKRIIGGLLQKIKI